MSKSHFFYSSLRVLSGLEHSKFNNELPLRFFKFRYYLTSEHSARHAYAISAAHFGSVVIDHELANTPGKDAASRMSTLLQNNDKRRMFNTFFSRNGFGIASRYEIKDLTESEISRRDMDIKHRLNILDASISLAEHQLKFGFDTYKKLVDSDLITSRICDFTFRRISGNFSLKNRFLYVAKRLQIDLSLSKCSSSEFIEKYNNPTLPSYGTLKELFSKVSYLNHVLGTPARLNFDTMLNVSPIKIDALKLFSEADLKHAGLGRRRWRRKWDFPKF